jgi:hypothetical protein
MARKTNTGGPLMRDAAAQRLSIAVADLPDLGRSWTAQDVAEVQRNRPEWLRSARKEWAATKAEAQRQRQARHNDVIARRADFTYPPVPDGAVEFAYAFTKANLLEFLHGALDASAADTYVVDSGFDVSTHASRANETNRERARRDVSLSDRSGSDFEESGMCRERGTLGDLFDAPTGNTQATYLSGAGLAAESWDDAWDDRWSLAGLGLAHVLAALVLSGDVDTLECIAAVPLSDVGVESGLSFDKVSSDVLSLAREALRVWVEDECPILDPEEIVDMDAPLAALPRLLLASRRSWDATESLAAVIAGVDSVGAGIRCTRTSPDTGQPPL